MSDWQAWIGREEQRSDHADPGLFTRWCATLDRAAPVDGLVPQGFHWCLCTPDAATAQLGPDGHPRRDTSLPVQYQRVGRSRSGYVRRPVHGPAIVG